MDLATCSGLNSETMGVFKMDALALVQQSLLQAHCCYKAPLVALDLHHYGLCTPLLECTCVCGGGGGCHGFGLFAFGGPCWLSPLHIPTLSGSKCVLVVSTEPLDDLSFFTTPVSVVLETDCCPYH